MPPVDSSRLPAGLRAVSGLIRRDALASFDGKDIFREGRSIEPRTIIGQIARVEAAWTFLVVERRDQVVYNVDTGCEVFRRPMVQAGSINRQYMGPPCDSIGQALIELAQALGWDL
jgi:hypothetical protein